jgi:broad specificity phosphatase PhoE
MNWYILRHAEKAQGDFYNPLLRHRDQPLSEAGQRSAEKLVAQFVDCEIAAIYVSAYQRTTQSAAPLAEHLNLSPIVDSRLNEIDSGVLDRMMDEDIASVFPGFWKTYKARTADFRFPGGESGSDVDVRIKKFFSEKQAQHPDVNLLIIGHEGWIRQMMCSVLGLPVWRRGDFKVDLCGLTELCYQEEYDRWQIICFNQKLLN